MSRSKISIQVILTHENADFDAIASLLAAKKLYPNAVPVLPRRINRNVLNFVTLYWDALPFKRLDELARRVNIHHAILVDTQGLATIRGMSKQLKVWVIDHHPPGEDLDSEWQFEGELIGSTTTLLVEKFPERGIRLTPIEATLLLLGIYEDTGSLTYGSTTSRDMRAAAWLLDRRADLGVSARFLQQPLTEVQRELFYQIQRVAEIHKFDGQSVVIAAVDAPTYLDEISTLAHKMRDLYDPDALFLLVQLEHHIQFVARSSVDTIDVGRIAAFFAGGGHSRAAAAIIREISLNEARNRLLSILPDFVEPLATVAQIMSYGVETVSPDMLIAEVHRRAWRLGYEGYPVVEKGRVVGLLTRRDIDRALQHKLDNVAVGHFMTAGEVYIRPGDTIQKLQQLMMEYGWGQIPVVSNDDGVVIGVVTRTDVIKLWQPRPVSAERDLMQSRIKRILPKPVLWLIDEIGKIAQEMGVPIYFVGGLVRDIMLELPNVDLDIVVEGDAISLARKLVHLFGGRVRTHARFGTAKWIIEQSFWDQFQTRALDLAQLVSSVDFVTARSEFYDHPTALPEISYGSIKLDLHRRDFTINTLAIRLDADHYGELLDFYGGKRDLESGLIRVLHSLSFIDDPTRILRAVRFEQRLNFKIEPRTEELLIQSITLLDRVTGDRIRHELELLFREPQPELGFARLADLGVLQQLHPALIWDEWVQKRFIRVREMLHDPIWTEPVDDYLIEFIYFSLLTFRMSQQDLQELEQRLKVQRITKESIRSLHALKAGLSRLAFVELPSAIYQTLREYREIVLRAAFVAADQENVRAHIHRYIEEWSSVRPHTKGQDLMEKGLAPGPVYRQVLSELLYARLDGHIASDDEENAYLQELLENR